MQLKFRPKPYHAIITLTVKCADRQFAKEAKKWAGTVQFGANTDTTVKVKNAPIAATRR